MAKEVEGEENAVDEQFVGGEEIGLWERRVSDHPELELWGVGIAASSAAAAGREGLGFKFESWALHGERSGGEAEKEEVGVLRNFSLSYGESSDSESSVQLTLPCNKEFKRREKTKGFNHLGPTHGHGTKTSSSTAENQSTKFSPPGKHAGLSLSSIWSRRIVD